MPEDIFSKSWKQQKLIVLSKADGHTSHSLVAPYVSYTKTKILEQAIFNRMLLAGGTAYLSKSFTQYLSFFFLKFVFNETMLQFHYNCT